MSAPPASPAREAAIRRRMALWHALRARPRLLAAALFGLAIYGAAALGPPLASSARTLLGWNAGALLYLGLAWHQMRDIDVQVIQTRAESQDEGAMTILLLVVAAAAAVLLAVGTQLSQAKQLEATVRTWHLALAGLTVLTSWLFTQVLFALHYAHDFYLARRRGRPDPLEFPATPDPGYADFFHFACVIGTAAQTADVNFHGPAMRPVGTLHCVLAFFFNAALLALSINVAAGLL